MTTNLAARNEAMLQDRIDGLTLREIGERHGLKKSHTDRIVTAEAREHLNAVVDSTLLLQGRGQSFSVVIPREPEQARLPLRYVTWLCERLPPYFDAGGLMLRYGQTESGDVIAAFIDVKFELALERAKQSHRVCKDGE